MARTEREQLCDLALRVGETEPTLCEGWDVKDLVVHLVLREGSLASVGIVVPWLSPAAERATERLRSQEFTTLVERLRTGPPRYSPYALPGVDSLVNSLELFVHHEDIRRARTGWKPRTLTGEAQSHVWRTLRVAGRAPVRRATVGVAMEREDTGERAVLRKGPRAVTVRGLPSEVALFVFGRKEQAEVDLLGADEDVAALRGSTLEI